MAIDHIYEVAAQFDVIGWNELGTAQLQLAVHDLTGFTSYMPEYDMRLKPMAGGAMVAISWRTDMFDLLDQGSIRVHGGVAHVSPSRHINYVLLRHKKTGFTFWRINTHVVHHIEASGKVRVRGAIVGQAARAKKHFLRLAKVTHGLASTHPVIGGGDLNVDYLAEKALAPSQRVPWFPYTQLGAVAELCEPDHGTHGGRLIDWTWSVGMDIGRQRVLPHGSSDHNPVSTTVLAG